MLKETSNLWFLAWLLWRISADIDRFWLLLKHHYFSSPGYCSQTSCCWVWGNQDLQLSRSRENLIKSVWLILATSWRDWQVVHLSLILIGAGKEGKSGRNLRFQSVLGWWWWWVMCQMLGCVVRDKISVIISLITASTLSPPASWTFLY